MRNRIRIWDIILWILTGWPPDNPRPGKWGSIVGTSHNQRRSRRDGSCPPTRGWWSTGTPMPTSTLWRLCHTKRNGMAFLTQNIGINLTFHSIIPTSMSVQRLGFCMPLCHPICATAMPTRCQWCRLTPAKVAATRTRAPSTSPSGPLGNKGQEGNMTFTLLLGFVPFIAIFEAAKEKHKVWLSASLYVQWKSNWYYEEKFKKGSLTLLGWILSILFFMYFVLLCVKGLTSFELKYTSYRTSPHPPTSFSYWLTLLSVIPGVSVGSHPTYTVGITRHRRRDLR